MISTNPSMCDIYTGTS